jgi:hypothetical protein
MGGMLCIELMFVFFSLFVFFVSFGQNWRLYETEMFIYDDDFIRGVFCTGANTNGTYLYRQ